METLLTESMISSFSSSGLLLGTSSGSVLLKLRGNFRQNGTQLTSLEYHAARRLRVSSDRARSVLCAPVYPGKKVFAGGSPDCPRPRPLSQDGRDNQT